MRAPLINDSTIEQRTQYIQQKYKCISNCETCGLCIILKGKDPLIYFKDYINGVKELNEIR